MKNFRQRPCTLDELRSRYREAKSRLSAINPATLSTLRIVNETNGTETEISEPHFLDDSKCQPGTYWIELDGIPQAHATLADPSGVTDGGLSEPRKEVASFISALMLEGRQQVQSSGQELQRYQARCRDLEDLTIKLMSRVGELEAARGTATGGTEMQRELLGTLQILLCKWLGIGGAAWTPETVVQAFKVLDVVCRNPDVQAAIRAAGASEPLKLLMGAA